MSWDWAAIGRAVDDVVVTVGIATLIVRQFIWRSAELSRMLRLPVLIVVTGVGYLVPELWGGFPWVAGDGFLVAELGLVAVAGAAMGRVTRFRTVGGRLQYRLTTPGVGLWAAFVAIRVGFVMLATAHGASLAGGTGVILLSFGTNRLAAVGVVRRRARAMGHAAAEPWAASPGEDETGGVPVCHDRPEHVNAEKDRR